MEIYYVVHRIFFAFTPLLESEDNFHLSMCDDKAISYQTGLRTYF